MALRPCPKDCRCPSRALGRQHIQAAALHLQDTSLGYWGATGSVAPRRAAVGLIQSLVLLFPQSLFDKKFDDIFGSSFSSDPFNFNSQNGMNKDDK